MPQETDEPQIDPVEFLRRALAISPEDAAQVREDAARRTPDEQSERPDEARDGD